MLHCKVGIALVINKLKMLKSWFQGGSGNVLSPGDKEDELNKDLENQIDNSR